MRILIIDGQGGGLGKALTEQIRAVWGDAQVTAVGTNALATAAMLKAGAHIGATGENAVVYNAARADVILGALGIGFANAMHGEITPAMAAAIGSSEAHKILLPVSKCNVSIVGVAEKSMAQYAQEAVALAKTLDVPPRA